MSSRAKTLLIHVTSVLFSVPQYLREEINRLEEHNRVLELLKYDRYKGCFRLGREEV